MEDDVIVHSRVHDRHPEISDEDAVSAWRNAFAIQVREYGSPEFYITAGADKKGRILELAATELDCGSILIYHAMKITTKMREELGL